MKRLVVGLVAVVAGAGLARRQRSSQIDRPVATRAQRLTRVWLLSARNGIRFAWTRLRGAGSTAERRAELDEQFAIRTATDVANELGQMKGVMMKAGQMLSFIVEALPDDAQMALATLQADATPMAPTLAARVVRDDLGDDPARVFLDWDEMPAAAASIGQVHRAVTPDGLSVAVKVQYPGVADAIDADLQAADAMYAMFSQVMLKGLDSRAFVDELRSRMREELDYEIERRNLEEFADRFAGHPWVRIPRTVGEFSSRHVLTTEWVDGMRFDDLLESRPATRQRAAEVIWRFSQLALNSLGMFNGDPHPGNYLFHHDGSVTFLDFGLVKRWAPGEWESLRPILDAVVIDRDPERLLDELRAAEFIRTTRDLDPALVFDYVSAPYQPYLDDRFQFSRRWMEQSLQRIMNIAGPTNEVAAAVNIPSSFVMLNRVVWGVNAIMSKLDADGPFRAMLLEYIADGEPATELGVAEAAWRTGTHA